MEGASAPLQYLRSEVTCTICFDYYKNPVTVDCGHSFCGNCIVSRQFEDSKFLCPKCERHSHVPVSNISIQLAKVTEIAKQMQLQTNKIPVCNHHGKCMTLFCREDQTIMCVLCKDSEGHVGHSVIPAYKVALEYKAELLEVEFLLKNDMENIVKWEYNQNFRFNKWKEQMKETQELIHHCFKKAHQLLDEEQKQLLGRLKREDDMMAVILKESMDKISTQRSSVQKLISDIEAKTKEPTPDFLRGIDRFLTRRNDLRVQEPPCVPFAYRLNICLPGILEMFQKYAAPVTLDPETAHFKLVISENGKTIRYEGSNEAMEHHPERINPESNRKRINPASNIAVMGSPRFVSGRHYWEVEFDVNSDWEVGVCLDAVNREYYWSTFPDRGFWTICTGIVHFPVNSPARSRIGIFLDYDAGELMFYSVTKSIAIKTFSETFTGTLRPYFEAHEDSHGTELTLCPIPQEDEDATVSYILA